MRELLAPPQNRVQNDMVRRAVVDGPPRLSADRIPT